MSKYKDTTVIRAEWYGPESEWDLDEELEMFNDELEEGQTPYTKDDIEDIWIKWNTLHVEFTNGKELLSQGYLEQDIDTKHPKALRGYSGKGERTLGTSYAHETDLQRALRRLIGVLSEDENDYVDSSAFREVMDRIEEARKVLARGE